jgi:hypothetical protein
MAKKSAKVGNDFIDIEVTTVDYPKVFQRGSNTNFAEWNGANYWNIVDANATFSDNEAADSWINTYNTTLKETVSNIINTEFDIFGRNDILNNNLFNYRISGSNDVDTEPSSLNGGLVPEFTSGSSTDKIDFMYPKYRTREYDYLQITAYEYEPPGVGEFEQKLSFFSPNSTESRITNKKGSIILPMIPGISEGNTVRWGPDSLSPIQQYFAGVARDAIDDVSSGNFNGGIQNFVDNLIGGSQEALANPNLKEYLVNYFAGQSVGANIVTRSSGLVINPNLELLFQGPNLRSFGYQYKLIPRDDDEAREIKRMIVFLKKAMAPKKNQNLFLKTPYVFKLRYIFGKTNKDHPFLNKIKTCALTTLNVDYTPTGNYMTYQDGSMVSYNLSLGFSELEPIYDTDYQDNDYSTMGY